MAFNGRSFSNTVPRVLVIENEYLVALTLASLLKELDCEVIGPALTIRAALAEIHETTPDAAILNLVLDGTYAYDVVKALVTTNVPFGFASGLSRRDTHDVWHSYPYLAKPYAKDDVEGLLSRLLPDRFPPLQRGEGRAAQAFRLVSR